jgi:MFS family permease
VTRTSAFAPLRETNFRWYYAATFVNLLGSMMAPIALAFAVLDLTDSAGALGQVLAARSIPLVVFLLVGGVIADRFDRALVMRLSNLLAAATQGIVAALVISGQAQLWQIIALEAVNGMVSAVSFPAMSSVVPQLVPRDQLQPANALLALSRNGLAVIGPSVAALLVVTVGSGWALAIDALSWLLSALLLARVRIPARKHGTTSPSMVRELGEGWALFRATTWLWVVVLAFAAMNAIHAGAWSTLGPALSKETIGPRGWGYVVSAEALGLLVMAAVLLRVSFRFPLRAGMLGCVLFSLPLFMLGFDPLVVPLAGAAFLAGAGIEVFGIGWNLAMQENLPDELLSRAYSYDALGSFVAIPIGQLLYGPLGEAFGFRQVLVVSGVLYAGLALVTLSSRSVRDLRRVTQAAP